MPSMLAHSRGSRWRQLSLRIESGEGVPRRRPECEEENEAETGGGWCEDELSVRCKEGGGQAAVMSISAAAVTLASACAYWQYSLVEAMRKPAGVVWKEATF